MREIPLTRGLVTLVDDEDAAWVGQYKWHASPRSGGGFYARGWDRLTRRIVSMHRVIMWTPPGTQIDHIDGNSLNNQKSNLRFATVGQNSYNRGKRTTNLAGYKGVSLTRKGYKAAIKANKIFYHLGVFDSAAAAHAAYCEAARRLHGEFARFE